MRLAWWVVVWVVSSPAAGRLAAGEAPILIDFRNRIPGVLDAPVFDVDGVTPLAAGYRAQVYLSYPERWSFAALGSPSDFQSGTNAGYWEPQQVALPTNVAVGARIWLKVVAYEIFSAGGGYEVGLLRDSIPWSTVVTNSPVSLAGLESFSLQPESIWARRVGDQIVVEWINRWARVYELHSTASLEAPYGWVGVPLPRELPWIGEVVSVTNAMEGAGRLFRLQRWGRPH